MDKIAALKAKVLSEGILDSETIHHEFSSGKHGRKLDFDKIETGSDTYLLWVDATVDFIRANYDQQPDMVIGVANGTNRLAVSVAAKLNGGVLGLMTEKESGKSSKFHPSVADVIQGYKPEFVLVLEDVGTSGGTSSTVVQKALALGAKKVEVLNGWQRNATLPVLDELEIPYRSLIVEPMPNFDPDNCDYCKAGVELVAH